jgi:hypothetical protein
MGAANEDSNKKRKNRRTVASYLIDMQSQAPAASFQRTIASS